MEKLTFETLALILREYEAANIKKYTASTKDRV